MTTKSKGTTGHHPECQGGPKGMNVETKWTPYSVDVLLNSGDSDAIKSFLHNLNAAPSLLAERDAIESITAERDRLREVNAALLKACKKLLRRGGIPKPDVWDSIEAAIKLAEGGE